MENVLKQSLSDMSLEELWRLFPIILHHHNSAYSDWYLEQKMQLEKVLGKEVVLRINHIGSTAVEGLMAKPTIDILLEVNKECNKDWLKQQLSKLGWVLMSSQDKPEWSMVWNKGYTTEGFAEKVFHLHVRYLGDWDELYFRDYLIVNPHIADKYGMLKQELQKKYEFNRDGYTEAKTEFVQQYTKEAREAFSNRYMPLDIDAMKRKSIRKRENR